MTKYRNEPKDGHLERWKNGVYCLRETDGEGAAFVYEALAKDGCGAALAQLGRIFEFGVGRLEPNFDAAVRWYKLSIEVVDEASSHLALARIYMQEPDRDPDRSLTFYHLELTVYNDVPAASFGLGLMYEHGLGVSQSIEKAREYYGRAVHLGHIEAKLRLAKIEFDEAPFKNFFPLLRANRAVRRLQRESPADPGLGLEYPINSYVEIGT